MDRETDSLEVKYKGVIILKIEYEEKAFNENFNAPEPFRNYVIKQGKAIFKSLQDGEIPEELLEKAWLIDKVNGGQEQDKWKSSFELSDAALGLYSPQYTFDHFQNDLAAMWTNNWTSSGIMNFIPVRGALTPSSFNPNFNPIIDDPEEGGL